MFIPHTYFDTTPPPAGYTNPYKLDFDGVNDYLHCQTNYGMVASTDYTWAMWVRRNSTGASHFLWNNRLVSGGKDGFFMNFNPSDYMNLYVRQTNGTIAYARTTGTQTDTTNYNLWLWEFDGTTLDTADMKIYKNDVSQALTSVTNNLTSMPTASHSLRIGASSSGTAPGDVTIDEAYMWERKLTAGEKTTLYNSGTPADISALSPYIWLSFDQTDYDANDPTPVTNGIANQGSRTSSAFTMTNMTLSDFI